MQQQVESKTSSSKVWLVVLSLSLAIFLFMFYNVAYSGPMLSLDAWVSQHVPSIQSQTLTKIIIFITNINGVYGSAIISALFIVFLLRKKAYKAVQFYLVAFLGASALFTVIKMLVDRARPALKIVEEAGLSFPSGHATMSITIALLFYFIIVKNMLPSLSRTLLLLLCILWPLIIVFTRIYLNVHWLSDTVAGLSLGLFWTILVYQSMMKR